MGKRELTVTPVQRFYAIGNVSVLSSQFPVLEAVLKFAFESDLFMEYLFVEP
jgi:hypothetical protein